jgi:hypothetical protein
MTYADALRMPVIDVISFWPNRSTGLSSSVPSWINDTRVEVFCLRPDGPISEDSITRPSGSYLSKAKDAKFSSEAITMDSGMLGWLSAAVIDMMLVL